MRSHIRRNIIYFLLTIFVLIPLGLSSGNDNIYGDSLSTQNSIKLINNNLKIISKNLGFKNDSFLILSKQTLKLSKANHYQIGINFSNFYIARIYDIKNNSDSAEKYYTQGLLNDISDIDLYSDFLLYSADFYRITGNLSSSLEKSLALKSLVENHQTSRHSYQVYNLLALSYLGLMEYDLAFENFNKSAKKALAKNNEGYAGVIYSNIGNLFYDQYKLNEALEYFEKGTKLEEKHKLYKSLGNSCNIIADIYLKLNNDSLTWYYLKKAKMNNLRSNNRIGLSKTYFEYSEVHLKSNHIDSAIFYLNKTVEMASKHNAKSVLRNAYLSLSKIYANKKDFEKAYYYHDLFFTIHKQIYNIEKISKAKAAEQKLIYQEKGSEIIELELKKQETINNLKNIIIIIGLLGSIIILIYLFKFRKLNQEHKKSKDKAEESDKLKSRFLQTISHEIRTPLNGIIGFSEMITSKSLSDAEMVQINDLILKNSDDLISTIENLVDIAHLSTKQYNVKKATFELSELLKSVFEKAENSIVFRNKTDIKLELNKSEPLTINSDKNVVFKIIQHIVKNAILFTNKGEISLGYNIDKTNVIIFVKDTGIGISQDKIDIIFSPFRNAEENINIKVGGTGLGLTIVNELIQILGGKIWVGSKLKKGTTFYVSLPIK